MTENPENLPEIQDQIDVPIVDGKLKPESFDGLWRIASMFARTPMVPDAYQNNAPSAFVAMVAGMEIGLGYMASLQNIAVVKGNPVVYADGVTGLIQGSGELEYMKEWYEQGGKEVDPSDLPVDLEKWPNDLKAVCVMKRKNQEQEYKGSFSVADARRMGRWAYKGVWSQHPARMLQWRARTWPARDGFSDILKGLKIFEEVIDYAVDMVKGENGSYSAGEMASEEQVKEKAKSGIELIAEKYNLDPDKLKAYADEVAETASITMMELISSLVASEKTEKDFIIKFKVWLSPNPPDSTGGENRCPNCDVPDCPGCETTELGDESPFQDVPPPEIDEDGFAEGMDPDKKAEIIENDSPEAEMGTFLLSSLNEKEMDPAEKPYRELLDQYVDYVSEITKQDKTELIAKMAEGKDWFDFFLSWIETDGMKENEGTSEEAPTVAEESASLQPPGESAQSSDKRQGASGATAPDTSGPEKPAPVRSGHTDFKKKWINMPGPKFRKYVLEHEDDFRAASKEDKISAIKKWDLRVKPLDGEEWPIKKGATEPVNKELLTPKQQLANLRRKFPEDSEAVQKALGFGQVVTTEEAAKKWVEGILQRVEGE